MQNLSNLILLGIILILWMFSDSISLFLTNMILGG